MGHEIGGNLTHNQTVFDNGLYWPSWKFQTRYHLHGWWVTLLFSKKSFITQNTFSCLSLINGHAKHAASIEVTPFFNLENQKKKMSSSHHLLSKSYLQHFKSFHCILPQQNLMQTHCSFKCHFRYTKIANERQTLVLNRTLLNNHKCFNPIPRGKWLRRLYLHTAVEIGQQECHLTVHMETIWLYHIPLWDWLSRLCPLSGILNKRNILETCSSAVLRWKLRCLPAFSSEDGNTSNFQNTYLFRVPNDYVFTQQVAFGTLRGHAEGKGKFVTVHSMKAYGETEIQLYSAWH